MQHSNIPFDEDQLVENGCPLGCFSEPQPKDVTNTNLNKITLLRPQWKWQQRRFYLTNFMLKKSISNIYEESVLAFSGTVSSALTKYFLENGYFT